MRILRATGLPWLPEDLVLCLKCRTGYLFLPMDNATMVRCSVCTKWYPIKDGVIDLLPKSSRARSWVQSLMESNLVARIYESKLWRRSFIVSALTRISFDQEYETITRAARLKGREILLDLACGTGIYARPLAQKFTRVMVLGLDLSLPMLKYANRTAQKERMKNLIFIHGDAMRLPFSDCRVDVVNCCGALHLFADPPRVLNEVSRVLRPGGRLTIAALRKRTGKLSERVEYLRKHMFGVTAFCPDELELHFHRAGLNNVQCHHAKGIWLIMSATKLS